jgi:hypothetical protein
METDSGVRPWLELSGSSGGTYRTSVITTVHIQEISQWLEKSELLQQDPASPSLQFSQSDSYIIPADT